MKRAAKALLVIVGAIALLAAGFFGMMFGVFPKSTKLDPQLKIESTEERRARGEYLAKSLLACVDCHSERDWSRFSGPIITGTEGKGGEVFGRELGFPGEIVTPNITPSALESWSDAELVRAITEGVSKDGSALFPVMPYPAYNWLCKDDVEALVAYVRSLPRVESSLARTELEFPVNILVRTMPRRSQALSQPCPDRTDKVAYGRYLVVVAACRDCHTLQKKGKPMDGLELGGGFEFPLASGGRVRSANITPDEETGIGKWSEKSFIERFRAAGNDPHAVAPGEFNTVMPWTLYAKLSDDDLSAMYAYLRSVPPVKNEVERFSRD